MVLRWWIIWGGCRIITRKRLTSAPTIPRWSPLQEDNSRLTKRTRPGDRTSGKKSHPQDPSHRVDRYSIISIFSTLLYTLPKTRTGQVNTGYPSAKNPIQRHIFQRGARQGQHRWQLIDLGCRVGNDQWPVASGGCWLGSWGEYHWKQMSQFPHVTKEKAFSSCS